MSAELESDPRNKCPGAWITIGSFDGVHLGHQSIINKLIDGSRKFHTPSIVVTFFPHPVKVLGGVKGPFYLSSPEEKDKILKMMGVDSILTLHFNHDLAATSAEKFIQVLYQQLKFNCLLIGYDFTFGANRSGNIDTLTALGKEIGFCVRAVRPFQYDSKPISSSMIRELISSGNMPEASRLLGRPYSLSGNVIHGDGRGKHIGLPTANLGFWEEKLVPGNGVYAAIAKINNQSFMSVINIGNRPTFYEQPTLKTVEAHILDFNQEIYGREIQLDIIERIRPEKKFASAQELMVQINQDIQFAREVLAHEPDQTDLPA